MGPATSESRKHPRGRGNTVVLSLFWMTNECTDSTRVTVVRYCGRLRDPLTRATLNVYNINPMKQHSLYKKAMLIIPILYVIGVSVYMISHRAWFSPDQFFMVAVVAVILVGGRTKQFLWDWIPVLLLLFGYEYLRGLAPILTKNPNVWPMIRADQFMFGYLPSIKLQELLYTPTAPRWYDYVAVILYVSHFVIPMITAFIFWMVNRQAFKYFTAGFLVLSYLAFITYVIFPAMPPWMASTYGYIPPLQKIMDQVMGSFAHPISVPSVYRFFGANLVAAVPSLHAAYPFLIFLFIRQQISRLAYVISPYVLGVWFSVVYLGEHYVVDVIIGILYAIVAYVIVTGIAKKLHYA